MENNNEHEKHSRRHSGKPWIISTIVLAIAVIILIFIAFGKSGSTTTTTTSVNPDTAANKLVTFAKNQGVILTVDKVIENGSFYDVHGSINGTAQVFSVTKDGQYLVNGLFPLDFTPSQAAAATAPDTQTVAGTIPLGDSPRKGKTNAKVTVIEFSDFSCPFCEAASGYNDQMVSYMKQRSPSWEPIVPNLLKDYVDTGKVLFVSKYSFGHSGGHSASLVSWCLNEQSSDLFWKFYEKAYSHSSADTESLEIMKSDAKALGADMAKLQSCLDSGKYNATFEKEQNESDAAGVRGTPAFVVNGQMIEGAVPYSQVKSVIETELAKN